MFRSFSSDYFGGDDDEVVPPPPGSIDCQAVMMCASLLEMIFVGCASEFVFRRYGLLLCFVALSILRVYLSNSYPGNGEHVCCFELIVAFSGKAVFQCPWCGFVSAPYVRALTAYKPECARTFVQNEVIGNAADSQLRDFLMLLRG